MKSVVSRGVRRSAAVWWSVIVTVLASGCSSSSPSDPSSAGNPSSSGSASSPSAPSASSSPADAAHQGAISAYLGMWEDMAAASETSNWQDQRLSQHAVGTALTNITRGLYADKANGLVTKGRPKNSPQVSSIEPPSAPTKVVISDCGDDSNWQHYRADNGQPANDGPSGRRQINAVVERQKDGAWRVTDFGIHEVGSC